MPFKTKMDPRVRGDDDGGRIRLSAEPTLILLPLCVPLCLCAFAPLRLCVRLLRFPLGTPAIHTGL
jgi:hypothetical protein